MQLRGAHPLRVAEGELFTYQKLVRSRQRLFNLGFFDEVNVGTDQGSTPDKIVVNIEVKERATGVFSIGAGEVALDAHLRGERREARGWRPLAR